jgi:V/A-type H+-transporting ATPase subunit I
MGVNKVCKAVFTVHNSILHDVLDYIQELGIIHIDEETLQDLNDKIFKLQEVELFELKNIKNKDEEKIKEFLFEIDKIIQFVNQNIKDLPISFDQKLELKKTEFLNLINYFEAENIINDISKEIDIYLKNNEEIKKFEGKIEHLKPFINFNLNLSTFKDRNNFLFRFGVINYQKYQSFLDEIEKYFKEKFLNESLKENIEENYYKLYNIEKISNYNSDIYFAIVSYKEIYKDIFLILRKLGGEEVSIEENDGIVSEIISNYNKNILKIEEENEKILSDIKDKFNSYYKNILAYYDYYYSLLYKIQTENMFVGSENFSVFTGWLLKKDRERLIKSLDKFKEIEIEFKDPEPEESVPISFKNKKLIKPYEMITNLYSPPKNGEIDPTPLFTPFFALFFAICTGDAGYGLFLAIVSFFLMRKYEGETKQLFQILFQTGILSIIVGSLMGTFFGFSPSILKKITIIDSMSSPLTLFGLSLVLGIIQLFYSYFIGFILSLSSGSIKKAFGEYLSYMLLIVSIVFLLAPLVNIYVNPFVSKIMSYVFVAGIVLVVLFMGSEDPKSDRIIKKFFGVYGLTGILGDILSYSRLLALSLSSGVIAMVINTLVKMIIGDGKNPISYLAAIIILLFGHTFNILIGALGAFVHSMRLQYVEFFKQFYEGGGKLFTPFSKSYKYIIIKD